MTSFAGMPQYNQAALSLNNDERIRKMVQDASQGYSLPDSGISSEDIAYGVGGLGGLGAGAYMMSEAWGGAMGKLNQKNLNQAVSRGELREMSMPHQGGRDQRSRLNPRRYTQGAQKPGPTYFNPQTNEPLTYQKALEIARQGKAAHKAQNPNVLKRATKKVGEKVGGKPVTPEKPMLLQPDSPIDKMSVSQKNELLSHHGQKARTHAQADQMLNSIGYDAPAPKEPTTGRTVTEQVQTANEPRRKTAYEAHSQQTRAVIDSKVRDAIKGGMSEADARAYRDRMSTVIHEQVKSNPNTRDYIDAEWRNVHPGRVAETITTNPDGSPKTNPKTNKPYTQQEKMKIAQQIQTQQGIKSEMYQAEVSEKERARQAKSAAETAKIVEKATLKPTATVTPAGSEYPIDPTTGRYSPDTKVGPKGKTLYASTTGEYVKFQDLSLADLNDMLQKYANDLPEGRGNAEKNTARSYNEAIKRFALYSGDFKDVTIEEMNRRLKNLGVKSDYKRHSAAIKAFNNARESMAANIRGQVRAAEARASKTKGGSTRLESVPASGTSEGAKEAAKEREKKAKEYIDKGRKGKDVRMGVGAGGATPEQIRTAVKGASTGAKAAGGLGGTMWGLDTGTEAIKDIIDQSGRPGGVAAGMGEEGAIQNAMVDALANVGQTGLGMGDFLTALVNPTGPAGAMGPLHAAYAAVPGMAAELSDEWFGYKPWPSHIGPEEAPAGQGLISKAAPHLFQDINPEFARMVRKAAEDQRQAQMGARQFGGSSRWR